MTITNYLVEKDFTILDTLFLKGDTLYISEHFREGGSSINWRKVFTPDKQLLGSFRDDKYWELSKYKYFNSIH